MLLRKKSKIDGFAMRVIYCHATRLVSFMSIPNLLDCFFDANTYSALFGLFQTPRKLHLVNANCCNVNATSALMGLRRFQSRWTFLGGDFEMVALHM